MFVLEKNKVNRMVRDAKSHFLGKRIKGSGSSRELFRIAHEMLGDAGSPTLPSSIPSSELSDSFNNFFIARIAQIRHDMSNQPSQPNNDEKLQGSTFSEFGCVTES